MNHWKHILEGALYAAGAAVVTSLSDSASALHLGEPWNIAVVAAIGFFGWARSWFDARAAAVSGGAGGKS